MSSELTYIPGTCNIGPSEIKRRRSVAYLGAVLTIITTIALLAAHNSHLSHIAVFIPAMIFSVGLVQSTKKFCFAFGLSGVSQTPGLQDTAQSDSLVCRTLRCQTSGY